MVVNFTQEGNVLSNIPGIYYIGCMSNNLMYIGSSISLQRRFYEHRTELRSSRHKNSHLLRTYNKYGESNFVFGELDYVSVDRLLEEEEKWIRDLNVCEKRVGFNKQILPQNNLGLSYNGAIVQLDKNCNVIAIHDSIAQAGRILGIPHGNISKVLKKERTSAGGFYWCYKDKSDEFKPRKNNYKGTSSELHRKALQKKGRTSPRKYKNNPILQIDCSGNVVKEWNMNPTNINRELNLNPNNDGIRKCLKGTYNTSLGFKWVYKYK